MFNEALSGGSWDATHCTTVLTEQTNTVCECAAFGTVAVIIEHVQPPEVDEEFTWLWITKYAGFSLSLLLLLVFVLVIGLESLLWDQASLSNQGPKEYRYTVRWKNSPVLKVSILGPVGPVGSLGPGRRKIQISQANQAKARNPGTNCLLPG